MTVKAFTRGGKWSMIKQKGHTIYSRIDDLPVNEELIGLFVSNRGGNHAPH